LQAENGKGINKASVDAAIAQYHAKRAVLGWKPNKSLEG
jgi:hypothetical protein